MKLLSLKEVRDMWPDPKPTEKAIRRLAKATGCCRKLGRAVGFTESDVEKLLSCCALPEIKSPRTGMSVARSPDAAYARAQALVTEAKQKRSGERGIKNSSPPFHLVWNDPLPGAKR